MMLHQNLGMILCGTTSGAVCVWSMDENTLLNTLEGHSGIYIHFYIVVYS